MILSYNCLDDELQCTVVSFETQNFPVPPSGHGACFLICICDSLQCATPRSPRMERHSDIMCMNCPMLLIWD